MSRTGHQAQRSPAVGPSGSVAQPGHAVRPEAGVTRHRLDVVGPNILEVVRCAGGWLFDRAMAGWEVTVLVGGDRDDRPLQILGVHRFDLESALASAEHRPRPAAVAVAAGCYDCDARVRAVVLKALKHGETEIALWKEPGRAYGVGQPWPAELDHRVCSAQHRLSSAARAFKAQALAAAGAADVPVGPTEMFRTARLTCRSVATDLIPG